MLKKTLAIALLGLLTTGTAPVFGQTAKAPLREDYQNLPLLATAYSLPQVLLVLSKDIKMFQQAYPGLADYDHDGRIETGFNPGVEYAGYFDSYSCYAYSGTESLYHSTWENYGDSGGYYYRVRAAVEDESEDAIKSKRPADLKSFTPSPRSITGVCTGVTGGGRKTFSGNWLNYVTTSRIDALRKILYGGTRSEDREGATSLESSFVPADSTTWGTEVVDDGRWHEMAALSPYFDISKFTPYDKPATGKSHFFARSRDRGNVNFPVMRVILDVDASSFRIGYTDSVGQTIAVTKDQDGNNRPRHWDWSMANRPVPNDKVFCDARINNTVCTTSTNLRRTIKNYRLTIKNVCQEAADGTRESNCLQYANGDYKPVGLLQEYGAGGNMLFGLMTGSYGGSLRRQGGLLRNHIDNINSAVNSQTGRITSGGLIANIDALRISGLNYAQVISSFSNNDYTYQGYTDLHSWGNPIGEMLYEGVRYFAGLNSATTSFTGSYGNLENSLTRVTNWSNRPSAQTRDSCAKPVILLISDVNSDYDGDTAVNSSSSDLSGPKVLSAISGNSSAVQPPQRFNMDSYLKLIDARELKTGAQYLYSSGNTSDCSPKTLTSLANVKGICPNAPAFEGTYSAAAVAYYGRTHDFGGEAREEPISLFAVTMSSAFPELTFVIPGQESRKISIMPSSTIAKSSSKDGLYYNGKILSFLNYYVVDWQTDSKGNPFSVTVQVNFSDDAMGDDWEMDAMVSYKIDLLTTAALTGAAQRTASPLVWGSVNNAASRTYVTGSLTESFTTGGQTYRRGLNRTDYYGFKNPDDADDEEDFLTINPSQVVGLSIESYIVRPGASGAVGIGYTISGTSKGSTNYIIGDNYDGTFFDLLENANLSYTYLSPPTCLRPHATPAQRGGTGCGSMTVTGQGNKRLRTFEFAAANTAETLPNPMWLAAKYGGYTDKTGGDADGPDSVAGAPDNALYPSPQNPQQVYCAEWEKVPAPNDPTYIPGKPAYKPCSGDPANYFNATNIADLAGQLKAAFDAISSLTSTGTATSASINSILGGGISIQTLYYPSLEGVVAGDDNQSGDVTWLGNVYGLYVDRWSNLRENSDGDDRLTLANGLNGQGITDPQTGELKTGDYVVKFTEPCINYSESSATCLEYSGELQIQRWYDELGDGELKFLKVVPTLEGIKPVWNTTKWLAEATNVTENRDLNTADKARLIYYGHPALANPGTPQERETVHLREFTAAASANLAPLMRHSNSLAPTAAAIAENPDYQDPTKALIDYIRGVDLPGWRSRQVANPWGGGTITWRLGDVINSQPIIVGSPGGNYDLLYGDGSFTKYKSATAQRRQVAFFGSNDGMLHAVNVGFYGSLASGQSGYSRDLDDNPDNDGEAHELGAELWAYIPTSVLPHLQWLADPDYQHSYYVDLKPYLVDVKLYDDSDAYGGWRTVLIGGLRLGGRTIDTGVGTETPEYSYPEYFALDVTDPERPPELLWRYSSPDLGMGVSVPTVVTSGEQWYVILASGPTTDDSGAPAANGGSAAYQGVSNQAARLVILNALDGTETVSTGTEAYQRNLVVPQAAGEMGSFFNDSFTPVASGETAPWHNHAVYFGLTVSRDGRSRDLGAVYRLKMTADDGSPETDPNAWELKRLFQTNRPVTGAVNSAYDRQGNLWVVFATGRLWGTDDLAPCEGVVNDNGVCHDNHQQYLFGLKEPLDDDGNMTFDDLTNAGDPENDPPNLADVSGAAVYTSGRVANLPTGSLKTSTEALDPAYQYNHLAMELQSASYIGYKKALVSWAIAGGQGYDRSQNVYEMALTQIQIRALSGGRSIMTFTSYQPDLDVCSPGGQSYLHLLDTFTGLPAPYMAKYGLAVGAEGEEQQVNSTMYAGQGLAARASFIGNTWQAPGQNSAIWGGKLDDDAPLGNTILSWQEVLDMGFSLTPNQMTRDLDTAIDINP